MSKNKKQQRNGFYYFMLDMQQDLRESGRFVPMRDMPLVAGPRWSKLPDAKKLAYNQRAKYEKRTGGGGAAVVGRGEVSARPGKMDCTGELLSERRDYAAEMEERRRREREIMRDSFPQGRAVALEKFYFVDIQTLCEIPDRENERFLPCELAAAEFSLHFGVHKTLHKFINPGDIPMGYRYLAKTTSEQFHEIPIDGFDLAEGDYRKILHDLGTFLNPDGKLELAPVYAKKEHAEKVEWCLQWLADKAGVINRVRRVYVVEALLCELSSHLDGMAPTFYQAEDMLKTSVYDHELGTRCAWHEERENKFCSLGTVNIYCYVLSDCLCPKYGIAVTKNHLPERPPIQTPVIRQPTTTRGRMSPYWSSPPALTATGPPSEGSVSDIQERMQQVSIGRGRGRGRGFVYGGAMRQPRSVGRLQQL